MWDTSQETNLSCVRKRSRLDDQKNRADWVSVVNRYSTNERAACTADYLD